jgi:hypothetical protein
MVLAVFWSSQVPTPPREKMAEGKGLGSCIKTEDREIRSLFLQWSNGPVGHGKERTDGTLYEACTHQQTSSWPRLGFLAFKFDFDPPVPYPGTVPSTCLAHTPVMAKQASSRVVVASPPECSPARELSRLSSPHGDWVRFLGQCAARACE